MLQNGLDLAARHAGEPLKKLLDGRSVLEVLEQSFDRDPRTLEGPGSAEPVGSSLHSVTPSPSSMLTVTHGGGPDKRQRGVECQIEANTWDARGRHLSPRLSLTPRNRA